MRHFLHLSTIERYFYTKRADEARQFLAKMRCQPGMDPDAPLDELPDIVKNPMMAAIARVRQACSHPSVIGMASDRFQRK